MIVAGLQSVRARAAYWQKRIELEKSPRKQQQLAMFAWAELARRVIQEGAAAYNYGNVFVEVVEQQLKLAQHQGPKKKQRRVRV